MPAVAGFFKCACGKLHQISGVRPDSVCACERKLWPQLLRILP